MKMAKSMQGPANDSFWGSLAYAKSIIKPIHALRREMEHAGEGSKATATKHGRGQVQLSVHCFRSRNLQLDEELQRTPGRCVWKADPAPCPPPSHSPDLESSLTTPMSSSLLPTTVRWKPCWKKGLSSGPRN